MEDMIAPIIIMLIIGGVAGYFVGLLVRRISSMAITLGILAFIIIALAYTGTIDINIESINATISSIMGLLAPLGIVALISSIPFVASFVAGIFIGYRRY
jgi:uncharacterized membrane protein (Fun14 family)